MSLSVDFVSSTNLTATVPAGLPAGVYTLTVRNPDGQRAYLGNAFTIHSATSPGDLYLPMVLRAH